MIQEAINIGTIFKIVLVLIASDAIKMERPLLQTLQRNNKGMSSDTHEIRFSKAQICMNFFNRQIL